MYMYNTEVPVPVPSTDVFTCMNTWIVLYNNNSNTRYTWTHIVCTSSHLIYFKYYGALYRCLCIYLQIKIYIRIHAPCRFSRTYTHLHVVCRQLAGAPNKQSLVWTSVRQAYPMQLIYLCTSISLSLLKGQLPRIQA